MPKCQHPDCDVKYASFNYPGVKSPRFCFKHRLEGMINVKSRKCSFEGCNIQPTFGYQGSRPKFCKHHKLPDMVDVLNRKCQYQGCHTQPNFNYPGYSKGIRCARHRMPNMIDVVNRRCQHTGCNKHAGYNYPGEKRRRFCYVHKLPGMVQLTHRKCIYPSCDISASYNYPNTSKPIYCGAHKKKDMISLKHPRCTHPSCNKISTYNYPSESKPSRCAEHKLPSMVDIVHKKCTYPDCNSVCWYGYPQQIPTRCAKHKETDMIFKPRKRCQITGCREFALYNNCKKIPVRCEIHKLPDDINLIEKPCRSCGLLNVLNPQGLCTYCDPQHFMGFRLARQREIKDILDAKGYHYTSYDQAVLREACDLKNRPDFLFNLKDHCVILEVDEDQHRSYDSLCECTRMFNIAQGLMKPTIFVRFNPDSYKNHQGAHVELTKTQKTNMLVRVLKYTFNYPPEELKDLYGGLALIQVFFDGFNPRKKLQLVAVEKPCTSGTE